MKTLAVCRRCGWSAPVGKSGPNACERCDGMYFFYVRRQVQLQLTICDRRLLRSLRISDETNVLTDWDRQFLKAGGIGSD
jgi:hypothetical protein